MFTLKIAYKKIKTVSVLSYQYIIGNNRAFTLLEVMISISIIAIIFISLFRIQSSVISMTSADKFNSLAPALAKQLLIKIEHDIADWSEAEGNFHNSFPEIEWTCEILDSSFGESDEALDFIGEENQSKFKEIKIEIKNSSSKNSYKIRTWRFADADADK